MKPYEGLLRTFMRKIYTPALLGSSIVRALVVSALAGRDGLEGGLGV